MHQFFRYLSLCNTNLQHEDDAKKVSLVYFNDATLTLASIIKVNGLWEREKEHLTCYKYIIIETSQVIQPTKLLFKVIIKSVR